MRLPQQAWFAIAMKYNGFLFIGLGRGS